MTISTESPGVVTSTADTDVVIVGGSVAGSTTATLLARHGARVTVVERSADRPQQATVHPRDHCPLCAGR
ncbi:MAG: FAD-dependent oxidoreductase [Rhodococcus sp. (in: high G+C Gram-positive bacteria)]|uniref:FAD-dependent oxidoreductase n=1 Tax=Nocardiaceae TaxID=85025 RepID=UPI001E40AE40|nr:FAD-dependent oxidoreductase [Rhodococcus yunnanensis]MCC8928989.1 FAD-dependent oxidoreductase [Rhodococcus sp. I2R]MCZ4278933.1 FAD-dependent oxidoreductase [Rhodococcus yunnanensis]